jgi:SAM-dependent methyltransferase
MAPQFDSPDHEQSYHMGRSSAASLRLFAQHHVLTARQGWILHPSIEKDFKSDAKIEILDIATGNGVWAYDIAQRYPNATVTGLDISNAQYPPTWALLDNMAFALYNLFEDVPESFTGKFDVVHLRFMHVAVPAMDFDMLLEKLKKLLRPGGWLQYVELTGEMSKNVNEKMQVSKGRPHLIYQHAKALSLPWAMNNPVDRLDDLFRNHGFVGVIKFIPPYRRHLMKIDTDNVITSSAEFLATSRDKIGDCPLRDELYQELENMQKDAQRGIMCGLDFLVTIGKKPME